MAPCGSRATAAMSSTVAGTEPVTPATMTGPEGGEWVIRSASVRMARLRRDAGDSSFFSARYAGQKAVMISRNLSVSFQCSEYSSGTNAGEPVERHVLRLDHVHEPRQLGGEVRGLCRRIGARCRSMFAEVRRIARIAADGLRPALHQHGEHETPLDFADGWRQVERVGAERAGAGQPREQRQIFIARRDGTDLRQRHGAAAGRVEESFLHGARGTTGRQQQRDVGKLERARRGSARGRQVALQDRGCDGFQERPPSRDSEDARAAGSAAAEAIRSAIKRRPHSRSTFPPRSRLPAFRRASTGHRGGCRTVVRCRSPCPTAD